MKKVIITFLNEDAAERFERVLNSLKQFRCGLRSIAVALRDYLQKANIHRE